MPIHDWTRVKAGIFHHFHHQWTAAIADALNDGVLPPDYYALAEQVAGGMGPDVLALQALDGPPAPPPDLSAPPGLAVAVQTLPPRASVIVTSDMKNYPGRQNTVIVRHSSGDRVVALLEIVWPGNKGSSDPLRAFVEKVTEALERGYHLLVVDLLPPSDRDPQGIHGAIWSAIEDRSWHQPADKPLTAVAYESIGLTVTGYVEPLAVGDELPQLPLFLRPGTYVPVSLEATYQRTWEKLPLRWRRVLE